MKPLRFTSVEQEEVKDYEPIGSSIKFDTQDDELERIINQRANAVKSDIEAVRAKNKQMAQAREAAVNESEESAQDASSDEPKEELFDDPSSDGKFKNEVLDQISQEGKPDDESLNQSFSKDEPSDETFVARIPSVKFDDEDLPKIKLVDDDDLAQTNDTLNEPSQGDTKPNDYENNDFSGLYEPLELKLDVNKNLQEISEALHEIDKMDAPDKFNDGKGIPAQDEIKFNDEEYAFKQYDTEIDSKDAPTQDEVDFNGEAALNSDPSLLQARVDLASENNVKIIDEVHKDVPEIKDEDLPCLKEAEPDVELKPAIDILDYVPYEPSEDEDEANEDAILSEEPKFSKNLEQVAQIDEKSVEELNLQTPSLTQEKSEKSDDKENSAPKFIIKNEEKLEKMHESKPQTAAQEINLKQMKERLDEQNLDARSVAGLNLSPKNEPAKPVRVDRAALLADLVADVAEPFVPQGFGIGAATEDDSEERAEIKSKLDEYLLKLIEGGGSDLHAKSGKVVRGRFNGEIVKMGDRVLDYDRAVLLAKEILGTNYYNLMKKKNVDFTYKLNDDFRFRANVFLQMDGVSFVFRTIPTRIPTMSELLLPPIIEKLCDKVNRGIILVTGPTGSGKTTTLASMINYLNHTKNYHIVTIEDPIEFIYNDDKSVINQRAIGQDVDSFADALRASLREDPDVIFVGEMRDLETVRTAINAAETGHLVLATLHTLDAKETIGRVINMFPKEEQNRIRMTFASVSEAIISQRLVLTTAGKRRVACEIMVKNIRVRDMILEDRDSEIYDAIEQSKNTYGMQTFEQHLLDMYTAGVITKEEALRSASRRENLDIKIKSADLAKKRAMVASIEEDDELLKEFQSEIIALKDIK